MPRRVRPDGRPWRTRKRRKFLGKLKQAREARYGKNDNKEN